MVEINGVVLWVMTPCSLVGGRQRSGEIRSLTFLGEVHFEGKARTSERTVCTQQTVRSDKQKDHFIKCPFVVSFIFEVVLELMQEYNNTGNVLEIYCLNKPRGTYKSRETLDGQDLPSLQSGQS